MANLQHAKRVDIVSIKLVRESSMLYKGRRLSSPHDAADLLRGFMEDCDRENMIVCCLDTKNQPTAIHVASIGSLSSAIVHPREIYKVAIASSSSSILICHNHPSGDPSPSQEDINITKRLLESGKILGIDLVDHLIFGDGDFISLKEKGII